MQANIWKKIRGFLSTNMSILRTNYSLTILAPLFSNGWWRISKSFSVSLKNRLWLLHTLEDDYNLMHDYAEINLTKFNETHINPGGCQRISLEIHHQFWWHISKEGKGTGRFQETRSCVHHCCGIQPSPTPVLPWGSTQSKKRTLLHCCYPADRIELLPLVYIGVYIV